MNLSFAGCGFLGIYHVGVAVCFKKYAPHILLEKISGASFGAISACCLLCDLPLGEITSDVLRVVSEARAGSLGPFSPSFNVQNVLLEGLQKFLPADAHKIVSGKLHISLTRVYDGKNVIVSEFASKEDLLQALLASCFVPVFSGMLPPRFHGIRYMDGGFSDNLPILDENTITVSPFCGESDICPRDSSSQLFHMNVANTSIELSKQNINRFARILFPPKPEVLSNMCKQGFDDALRFLHRNNLISCTKCLAIQSTFQLRETLDDSLDYDPDCKECKSHRENALDADLPDTVMTVFQAAIEKANKGLLNWVFRHRGMKILSMMTIPYRLPVDIAYATVSKFLSCTPKMSRSLWYISLSFLQQLHGFLYSAQDRSKAASQLYYKLTMESRKQGQEENDAPYERRILSRTASAVRFPSIPQSDDTYQHILDVTQHNDALIAYYYLDEGNNMQMTEIFDVTNADSNTIQTASDQELSKQMKFDAEWSTQGDFCDDAIDLDIAKLEEDTLEERHIFSDPESDFMENELELEQPESDRVQNYNCNVNFDKTCHN